jgi:lipopolysaccharide heptosyltransferase I
MAGDVLFVKTSSIGDLVHHMPALTEARQRRPGARFAWVVEESFVPLVKLHPGVDEIIPVASRRWRRSLLQPSTWREVRDFRRKLKERTYDHIIDTQGLLRSAMICRIAHGLSHGYDPDSIRETAASRLYDVQHRVSRGLHAIERNRILTGLALGYVPKGEPNFGIERVALAQPSERPYAVFLHGTARQTKEWPQHHWMALGEALDPRGLRIILPWGTESERTRSEMIAARLSNAEVPARQPLDVMARLIAGASLVIGLDTGLLHLAAALDVPVAAVFVDTEPALARPMGNGRMALVGGKAKLPAVADVMAAVDQVL